jgi:hypothetical protein
MPPSVVLVLLPAGQMLQAVSLQYYIAHLQQDFFMLTHVMCPASHLDHYTCRSALRSRRQMPSSSSSSRQQQVGLESL